MYLESEHIRQPGPGEPPDEAENNNEFNVRFFLPDDFATDGRPSAEKHLLILTNGLGEFDESMYVSTDGFCEEFRKQGVASAFLPVPFHFGRLSNLDNAKIRSDLAAGKKRIHHPAVQKILRHPERFRLGYEQLWSDIGTLTEKIVEKTAEGHFPKNLLISLWGYSIGGLSILSHFLTNPKSFHSCILVHSGANLENLGHNRLLFTREQWDYLKDFYRKGMHLKILPSLARAPELMFSMLFLGERRDDLLELMKTHCCKILLFVGAKDDVENQEGIINSIVPGDHGLAIHVLPGLTHFIMRPAFRESWFEYEVQTITAFLNCHP